MTKTKNEISNFGHCDLFDDVKKCSMKRITLVTGGSRSGKSKHALELAASYNNKAFIATAEATDDEMQARIERHRRERDPSFHTWEEPVDLEMA